jgi:DMSO/TMAO reductase YedYZ molybdopterin-dependent catalytic subunit
MARREFLTMLSAAMPLAASWLSAAPPNRIVRMQSPQNLEGNFNALDGLITPTEQFYVRNHFPVPAIDPSKWILQIEGAVERPLSLTLAQLKSLESKTRPLLLECAGNGRVFLAPQARGVQWQLGAVGCAEWTGVPLSIILERAGVKKSAVEVVFQGADSGTVAEPPSPGPISYDRSLPLEKALQPEVMLAWGMNGKDLLPAHGAPLRAVVGGWYGMASVKWLTRILVVEKPYQGFWQTLDYTYFNRVSGLPTLAPITAMRLKSQIARPSMGEVIPAGKPFNIVGAAWTGGDKIGQVDVSADGGKTWKAAKPIGSEVPFCWRLWEYEWQSPKPGKATLMCRAKESSGLTQPMDRNADNRTYMIHHVMPVEVEVR